MKEKSLLLFILCMMTLMFSCEGESLERISIGSTSEMKLESGSLTFIYNGKKYFSDYEKDQDHIDYKNQSVGVILSRLEQRLDLAILIHEDGTVEYFDNIDMLKSNIVFRETSVDTKALTQPFTTTGYLTVYEDKKCKGRSCKFVINESVKIVDVNSLRSPAPSINYNWDNIITSFDLSCDVVNKPIVIDPNNPNYPRPLSHGNICLVTFYSESNFGGASISFDVRSNNQHGYIHDLGKYNLYPQPLPVIGNPNWNDQISSLRFQFIN